MVPPRWSFLATLLLTAAMALPGLALARAKTDLVYLKNGDRLTGEIRQLDRGIVALKTDAISTVNIEWADVDSVNSVYQFRVEDSAGNRLFGSIFLRHDAVMEVIGGGHARTVAKDSVVVITPLEASFWQQLDGSVSLSFSYTKAQEQAQLSFSSWVMRRTTLRQTRFDFSSTLSNSAGSERSLRYDFSGDHRKLLRRILFAELGVSAQRNDELGLDLRVSTLAALGANIVHTNRVLLVGSAGLSVNHEWANDGVETTNLEGVLTVEHDIFAYNYPKTDYTADLTLYPSLSDWGRVRLDADLNARRELVKDFFVNITFYESYDNRPPGGGEKTDYGTTFGVSWSF